MAHNIDQTRTDYTRKATQRKQKQQQTTTNELPLRVCATTGDVNEEEAVLGNDDEEGLDQVSYSTGARNQPITQTTPNSRTRKHAPPSSNYQDDSDDDRKIGVVTKRLRENDADHSSHAFPSSFYFLRDGGSEDLLDLKSQVDHEEFQLEQRNTSFKEVVSPSSATARAAAVEAAAPATSRIGPEQQQHAATLQHRYDVNQPDTGALYSPVSHVSPMAPLVPPKRPLNAYNLFFRDYRLQLMKQQQGQSVPFATLGKKVGHKWQSLAREERERWEDLAQKEQERYQHQKLMYKAAERQQQRQERRMLQQQQRKRQTGRGVEHDMGGPQQYGQEESVAMSTSAAPAASSAAIDHIREPASTPSPQPLVVHRTETIYPMQTAVAATSPHPQSTASAPNHALVWPEGPPYGPTPPPPVFHSSRAPPRNHAVPVWPAPALYTQQQPQPQQWVGAINSTPRMEAQPQQQQAPPLPQFPFSHSAVQALPTSSSFPLNFPPSGSEIMWRDPTTGEMQLYTLVWNMYSMNMSQATELFRQVQGGPPIIVPYNDNCGPLQGGVHHHIPASSYYQNHHHLTPLSAAAAAAVELPPSPSVHTDGSNLQQLNSLLPSTGAASTSPAAVPTGPTAPAVYYEAAAYHHHPAMSHPSGGTRGETPLQQGAASSAPSHDNTNNFDTTLSHAATFPLFAPPHHHHRGPSSAQSSLAAGQNPTRPYNTCSASW